MEIAVALVLVVLVVGAVEVAVRRVGGSAPLVLVVVGVVGSYLPFVPDVTLEPDLVLVGLLPPLLYAAALRTSLVDFRHNVRAIGFLSVGLVVVTTGVVGVVVHALLPVSWPVAFALGAVVAPPDAVAASAVARRVGLPRRVVTILEGESLVNDATALVLLRTAIGATGAAVSVVGVAGDLLLAAGGGVAVGVVVAWLAGQVRRRLSDAVLDTSLSLTVPFVAYLPAEEIGASGVLAVVVAGLLLGHRSPVQQTATARIAERLNWRTVQFLLEDGVFLLIGLQAADVVRAAVQGPLSTGRTVVVCLLVLLTVAAVRLAYVFPVVLLTRLLPGRGTATPPWGSVAVIGWAGMRGVVTLAAVFTIPPGTPLREVLVLAALVVVGGTLGVQGATLPLLVRWLRLPAPEPGEDALAHAAALQRAQEAGELRLKQVRRPSDPEEVVTELRERLGRRSDRAWERLGRRGDPAAPGRAWVRLRLEMLDAERTEVLRLRDEGTAPDDVLRRVLADLDVEESLLDRAAEDQDSSEEVLRGPAEGRCEHLLRAPDAPGDVAADACEGCVALGQDRWEHLRQCLGCGYVGCCDSSPHRHAQAHARRTGHPVIRSAEPGEAWRWCYVDRRLG